VGEYVPAAGAEAVGRLRRRCDCARATGWAALIPVSFLRKQVSDM